ncbi:hypothetical protein [Chitinivorax sp. B]|uniref:hypothetical protein n=1 Tax=Chitinivorax sp. B TaxID=2502235 RepID=UPI0014857568|nr:hypothetical protein [Chitinivorax sp. B]
MPQCWHRITNAETYRVLAGDVIPFSYEEPRQPQDIVVDMLRPLEKQEAIQPQIEVMS